MNLKQGIYEFFCLHRKNLLYTLVARNLKVKYRGSVLGFFWTLLLPFAQILVFYYLYKVVMKVEIPNYLAFMISGVMPWVFFSATVMESMETLVASQSMLTQAPVPIQSFPAAAVVSHFVNLLLSLPFLVLVILISGIEVSVYSLLSIPLLMLLFLFTYSLAFILASVVVVFRDMRHLFGLVVQLWLYMTPVFYSPEMVPEQFRWILMLNPLSGFFSGFRNVLLFEKLPDPTMLMTFVIWSVAMLLAANVLRVTLGPKLVERA